MTKEHFSIGDLVGLLRQKAPFDYAEEWDNVGHLAGDAAERVTGIVVSVNLGPEALQAAEDAGANVVVCHHPPIFKPLSRLTRASSPYLFEAVRRGVNVIALHTNFDLASEAMNRELAENLGFRYQGPVALRGNHDCPPSLRQGKFITYVPPDQIDKVREAVCKAGAGQIGNYSQCSFSWDGEGTFFGGEGANPRLGKTGCLEKTHEKRLEVVFPWRLLDQVVAAARAVHPYEEMAFDILELAQPARQTGYGFVGDREAPLAFHKVLEGVKETFQLQQAMVSGPGLADPKKGVRRLAFSPGSGSAFVGSAVAKGADVYVCGEMGYHQMLEARQKGLTLVVLGHSYSERFFVETVSSWCESLTSSSIKVVKKVFEMVHSTI